ncbi:MAG: ABC transporter permease [Cyanobacteria bacterium J06638_22]
MNLGRVFVIATNVFREVIRDRILYLVGLYAVLLFLAGRFLVDIAGSTEDKMLLDLGLAAISIVGLVIAVFIGTGLVNKEIEKRTVYVLISKPVSRLEFIVGKHLGLSAMLAVLIAAMTVIYFIILEIFLFRTPTPYVSVIISSGFQFIELSLITAVAILFGVFTSPLLATLLTFGVYLMGQSSRDLLQLGAISESSGFQRVTEVMYVLLPDLSRLNLKNQAVYGMELMPSGLELTASAIYALVYIALLLAISTFIFARRQF